MVEALISANLLGKENMQRLPEKHVLSQLRIVSGAEKRFLHHRNKPCGSKSESVAERSESVTKSKGINRQQRWPESATAFIGTQRVANPHVNRSGVFSGVLSGDAPDFC